VTEVTVTGQLWPPTPPGVLHFVSGASAHADLRGLLRFSVPVGVSAPALSAPSLAYLLAQAHRPLVRVFVDTGAFSEVADVGGRLEVVSPIDEAGWAARVGLGQCIARAFGDRAYVVVPDRVGDQAVTLSRLERWAAEIRAVHATGAHLVVPLQRGPLSTAAFEREAAAILRVDGFTCGIPSNKDAMPLGELEAYLRASRPEALHLLGLGPRSPRLPGLLDLCRRLAPRATVSCDSNGLAALVGHTNGPGGRPRALTEAQAAMAMLVGEDRAREAAVAWVFGPSQMFALAWAEYERRGLVPQRHVPSLQLGLFDGAAPSAEAV
jgi:hypothetical protein